MTAMTHNIINPNHYGTITMDPPWSNKDLIVPRPEDKRIPYPVASLQRIASLPVPMLAAPNCHLYIWCMCMFVPQAIWLASHWGFKYYNMLTWVKPDGFGYNWANRTEHMVFAFRDRLVMKNKLIENVFGARSQEHSRKPEISYEVVERASNGPYLEMFARRPRQGWHVWGNEVQSDLEITI